MSRQAPDAAEFRQLDLLAWEPSPTIEEAITAAVHDADAGDPWPALLRREDPRVNMRRFYGLALARSLFGEWGVVRRWGRLGAQGQVRTDWHDTREAAEVQRERIETVKRRRGYR